jgi:hypothetical protein
MTVAIIADHGTHLLIADGQRYAVIERREDHLYNCHDAERAGIPAKDLSSVEQILADCDWTDRETAEATFDGVVTRGTELAQRM